MKRLFSTAIAALVSFGSLTTSAAPRPAMTKAMCVESHDRGLSEAEARSYRAAREDFLACTSEACPAIVREDCAKELAEVTSKIPSLVFAASQGGTDVTDVHVAIDNVRVAETIDGTAHDVEPGPHVVRFERAGRPPIEVRIVAREGDKNRVVAATYEAPVVAPPPTRPVITAETAPRRPVPVLALILGGVGLGSIAVGTYVRLDANSDAAHFRETCAPDCAPGTRDDLSTRVVASNIVIGAGIGLLGVAAVTWFLRTR